MELEEIAATEVREMRHDMKQQYMYLRNWQIRIRRRAHGVLEKLIGESTERGVWNQEQGTW